MNSGSSCFCHPQMTNPPPPRSVCSSNRSQSMDLDSALNELGMLSSCPDSRRQYLAERRRREMVNTMRERKVSEPSSYRKSTSASASCTSGKTYTPSNSPIKGYQIVQINPTFVTNFSTAVPSLESLKTENENGTSDETGSKFNQENVELEGHSRRLSRLRISRVKRFRKPYEMPWLQRHSVDTCYPTLSHQLSSDTLKITSSSQSDVNNSSASNQSNLYSTPEKLSQGLCERNAIVTNSNTPDRPSCHGDGDASPCCKGQGQFVRSRSLDELDFAKLKVAESETKNYIKEKREIENVSQYLQNLNVNE